MLVSIWMITGDDETDEKDEVGDYDPDDVFDPSQVPSNTAATRTAGQTRREDNCCYYCRFTTKTANTKNANN